jgi:hypothetical protein
MEKKRAVSNVSFADAEFETFESTKNGDLFVHLKSWNEKRLKIIFTNSIRFTFITGGVVSNIWEEMNESSFLNEAIMNIYEKAPVNHCYKVFEIEDIEDVAFIQVVAKKIKVVVNWTLLIINNKNTVSGKEILEVIKLLKGVITMDYVIISGSDELDILIASITEKEGVESKNLGKGNEEFTCAKKPVFLMKKKSTILERNKLIELIPDTMLFHEANFFFSSGYPYPEEWDDSKKEIQKITQTVLTIRIVDSHYIYVYTPYSDVESIIKEKCNVKNIEYNWLENLNPET